MAKQQWEEEAKNRFLQFLSNKYTEVWTVLHEDVVVDPASNRNFDYELGLGERRMALELFRLANDEEELARDKVWSEVVHALERELARRSLSGYLLNTPSYFNVPRVKRDDFVKELADRIEKLLANNPGADELTFEGFSLKKIEGMDRVGCATIGPGGAINPTGIALAALAEKLPNKNLQLAVDAHERVIVVVNWAYLVDTDDVVEAASQIDFGQFSNIDKAFFEVKPGDFQLFFDRALFAAFEAGEAVPSADLEPLYTRWLAFRLARKERRAFDLVKKLAAERNGISWLPSLSRIEVVRYGTDFAKASDWDNVLWIVRNFKNDPDPSTENAADDPDGKLNSHRSIERGECVRFIVTVRGHLCWLLYEIVSSNRFDLYEEVFGVVENYALGPNLYIRQQATIPLSALMARRNRTSPDGQLFMQTTFGAKIRALMLTMVQENADYPCVLEWVAKVLAETFDLNAAEAENAFNVLLKNPTDDTAHSLCDSLIFNAIFRERHKDKLGAFDAGRLSHLLKSQIVGGAPIMRVTLLWLMSRILDKQPGELNMLLPYICLLSSGDYERSAFFHFYRVVAEHMNDCPTLLGPALSQAFHREREYFESNKQESIWDFDRQRLVALKRLIASGRVGDFLDCAETVLDYRQRIFNFPADDIRGLLQQTQSQRAQSLQSRLDS
jgi:hypothetical protein